MMLKSSLFATLVASIASIVNAADLSGSARITPQDYYGLPASALANNPPACGMPYNQLNLARITAVAKMNTGSTCNLCLKVVNSDNPSKFIYVLAVDLGGSGLDLSIPSFEYLFGQRYDASPASWTTVASSYCEGIYTPGKVNTNQGISGGSSPATTTTKKTTTTTKSATKTTKSKTTKSKTTKSKTTKSKTTKSKTTKSKTTKTTKPKTTKSKTTKTTKTKKTHTTKTKKTHTKGSWWKTTKNSRTKKTKNTRSHRSHGDEKKRQRY
ncbi:hypothetical protein MAM1_0557c10910 [Mucor ambiguus]|uniref:Expansin-like EG45 domain-containing protein n=1 Tax=Mucor ambiguus TaxID=91626 RepID=A0A0C9MKP7_9FUNG|nr:hypothetical protein MAM1_0557c10910 [Mucor ambiguus]